MSGSADIEVHVSLKQPSSMQPLFVATVRSQAWAGSLGSSVNVGCPAVFNLSKYPKLIEQQEKFQL